MCNVPLQRHETCSCVPIDQQLPWWLSTELDSTQVGEWHCFFRSALSVIVVWNRMSVLCSNQTQTSLVLLRLSNQSSIRVLVLAVPEELLASHPSACNLSWLHLVTTPKASVCRAARQPQSCRITSSSLLRVCRMRTESPGPRQRPAASPSVCRRQKLLSDRGVLIKTTKPLTYTLFPEFDDCSRGS